MVKIWKPSIVVYGYFLELPIVVEPLFVFFNLTGSFTKNVAIHCSQLTF